MEQQESVISLSKLGSVGLSFVIFIAWLALWAVAMLMEYAPHASIWFPPAGLSFAFLFAFGLRAIPGIVVSIFITGILANLLYGSQQSLTETLIGSLYFSIAHVGSYGIAAYILKWVFRFTAATNLVFKVLWFLIIGSVATLLTSFLGIHALILSDALVVESFAEVLMPWWVGDLAGVLVLAPVVLALISSDQNEFREHLNIGAARSPMVDPQSVFLKVMLAIVLLATTMALTKWTGSSSVALLIFLVAIPLVWTVKSDPAFATGIMLIVLSFFTALFVDIFAVMNYAIIYQFALIFMACVAWISLASHKDKVFN
ncbi:MULTISPECIES: MASE1 domain-containing protein [Gammaproteobacteria]|uniref:MASE1 domain-containing protein n=1 Tax=Gammaproteobacteria TaxID=1236 RepID=UPI000DCF966F|nr:MULTISPECIES: MASE1 domain-containing protein [Gammaproteobacteria]RTE87701.1 hypothetical protein DQX04_04850 [Aliidiomarina sp. B3213]TCZ92516.1 hypothetical protein EYQ95_00445 [Lysobacter sp. N42]